MSFHLVFPFKLFGKKREILKFHYYNADEYNDPYLFFCWLLIFDKRIFWFRRLRRGGMRKEIFYLKLDNPNKR